MQNHKLKAISIGKFVRAKLASAIVILSLGVLASGNHVSANELDPVEVEKGRELAESYCSSCHAIGVEGRSTHPHSPPFRIISKMYPVEHLEEAFAEGIYTGHPDMPAFEFTVERLSALLEYIKSVQQ